MIRGACGTTGPVTGCACSMCDRLRERRGEPTRCGRRERDARSVARETGRKLFRVEGGKRTEKYRVTGVVTISISTDVKAKSAKAALAIAAERGMQSLCYQCATGDPDNEWVTCGELDGEPCELEAEKVGATHA